MLQTNAEEEFLLGGAPVLERALQLIPLRDIAKDFENPIWERLRGNYRAIDVGANWINAPFQPLPASTYTVVALCLTSPDIVKHVLYVTGNEWQGTRVFVRTGTTPAFIVAGRWQEIPAFYSDRGYLTTNDNNDNLIYTLTLTAGQAYATIVDTFARNQNGQAWFAGKYFGLFAHDGVNAEIVQGFETITQKASDPNTKFSALAVGNNIEFYVKGVNNQLYDWTAKFELDPVISWL